MATRTFQQVVQAADRLDRRRRDQIANQAESITRLLEQIRLLENEKEDEMGKRRDAFLAGFEQGTLPKAKRPDPDEAFDEYKASLDTDEDTDDDSDGDDE